MENPLYAMFNLIICLINLMPVLPFDGGRLIQCFFYTENRFKLNSMISRIFVLILFVVGSAQIIFFKNYYFIVFAIYICSITMEELKKEKLCKAIDYLQTKQETLN